jgi:hypothetical protein
LTVRRKGCLRLLESYFTEKDIQRRRAVHRDLQMVREDGDPLQELFDQDTAFGVLCGAPDGLYIKVRKYLGYSFESALKVALRLSLRSALHRLCSSNLNVH